MRRFLSEVLWLQLVATYLVVLGHSYPFVTAVPSWLSQTQQFLYTFHMPLFVWVSGYLLVYTDQSLHTAPGHFVGKRFKKLLLPYILLSLIAIVPKYAVQPYLNDSLSLDVNSFVRSFLVPRENIWGHFWFLPMIFILGVFGYLSDRLFCARRMRDLGWGSLTVLLFVVYIVGYKRNISGWFSLDDLICFGWVFSLGALCGSRRLLERYVSWSHVRSFSSAAFVLSLALFLIRTPYSVAPYKSAAIAITMIAALTGLCSMMSSRVSLNRNSVYARTFTVFLLSWPFQAVFNVLIERLLHQPYWMILPVQFTAGVLGPVILIYLIEKIEHKYNIHWISYMIGK